jgi:Flp pilus assembly protein TadB
VGHIREQSLVWATYVTAALFILATLFIAGVAYTYVPYLVFFVFLILFIVKFKFELHRFNKGGAQ